MKDLVEPAVHGTQNVLSSVAKSKDTVKRVIQTSSFAGKPLMVHSSQPHGNMCSFHSSAWKHTDDSCMHFMGVDG